jgi:hypothetical protein
MNQVLKNLKDIFADPCVTIVLNTHRTKPDYLKDGLVLKNLQKQAEERLMNDYDKRFVRKLIAKLSDLTEKIDHSHNLESLVVFVNEEIAEYTRLPIPVEDRVVVDHTFATRDLVRAMHHQESYYVLVISRDKARLIEASSDKVVEEIGRPFPIENKKLYTTDRLKLSTAQGQDNLTEEFFNQVDKIFQAVWKDHPLPVLVCTEERNFHHYQKVADKKDIIIGHLNKNRLDEKPHHIVEEAWPIVHQNNRKKNEQRLAELGKATGEGKLLSDLNDVWKAVNEGRGQTIFVQKDYFQPARVLNGQIHPVGPEEADLKGVVDDIIDEIIELNLQYGGDAVYLTEEHLKDFRGLALIARY